MLNPGLLKGWNFIFPVFPQKRGVISCSISPLKFLRFVSRPAWVFDQFLNSFPNRPSSSPAIEGGYNPVRKIAYLFISMSCIVYIATRLKDKTRNYIVVREQERKLGVQNRTDLLNRNRGRHFGLGSYLSY